MQKFCKFAYLKLTFSILHFHFYKTLTSVCLLYTFIQIKYSSSNQSTPTQPPPSTQWPNFESKIDFWTQKLYKLSPIFQTPSYQITVPFSFLSSSSHLFINNNAIPNPILFTFFKNYNSGTKSNHFHCISGLCLLPYQTPSYSHCSSCTVRTEHRRNCHSETHSAPTQPETQSSQIITHPTRNP